MFNPSLPIKGKFNLNPPTLYVTQCFLNVAQEILHEPAHIPTKYTCLRFSFQKLCYSADLHTSLLNFCTPIL
jgi:hypothetical protein